MGISLASSGLKGLSLGGTVIKAVYLGEKEVWSTAIQRAPTRDMVFASALYRGAAADDDYVYLIHRSTLLNSMTYPNALLLHSRVFVTLVNARTREWLGDQLELWGRFGASPYVGETTMEIGTALFIAGGRLYTVVDKYDVTTGNTSLPEAAGVRIQSNGQLETTQVRVEWRGMADDNVFTQSGVRITNLPINGPPNNYEPPRAAASDGTTVWFANETGVVKAFTVSTGNADTSKDYTIPGGSNNYIAGGTIFKGVTYWLYSVIESSTKKGRLIAYIGTTRASHLDVQLPDGRVWDALCSNSRTLWAYGVGTGGGQSAANALLAYE